MRLLKKLRQLEFSMGGGWFTCDIFLPCVVLFGHGCFFLALYLVLDEKGVI